jgi:flagellar biogenesis protein FliO
MKKAVIILSVLISLLTVGSVYAQPGSTDTTSLAEPVTPGLTGEMMPTLVKLGMALLFIAVLIYVAVIMLKKLSSGKVGRGTISGSIEIVDRHFLSQKKQLCLVKVDQKYLLVGATEQTVNLVADVSDQNFHQKEVVSRPDYQGFSFRKFFTEAKNNLPSFSRQAENPQKS